MNQSKIQFQVSILLTLLGIVLALTAAIFTSVLVISTSAAEQTANGLFDEITKRVHERVQRQIGDALSLTELGASRSAVEAVSGDGLTSPALPLLMTALRGDRALYSVYYGFADGSYLQVVDVNGDGRIVASLSAPTGTQIAVRAISAAKDGSRRQVWSYLDATGKLMGRAVDDHPAYDPRQRPWYVAALSDDHPRLSAPYVFSSLKEPGLTASHRLPGGNGVFGADIALSELEQFIEQQSISPGGGIVLTDQTKHLLAAPVKFLPARAETQALPPITSMTSPQLQALTAALGKGGKDSGGQVISSEIGDLMIRVIRWEPPASEDGSISIAAIAPMADFAGHIAHMRLQMLLITLVIMGISVPAILILSRRMALTVRALAEDAKRIERFDFSHQAPDESHIQEFHQLSQAFAVMKHTIAARTEALEQAKAKLARLVELGIAVSAEQDNAAMLRTVLDSAKDLGNAEAAQLYRLDVHGALEPVLQRRDDALASDLSPIAQGSDSPLAIDASKGISLNDGPASRLTVPLMQRGGEVAGVLQLERHRGERGQTEPFSDEMQRFVEALAAQAATAMHNHELLADAHYRLERLQVQQELGSASRTQMALLPTPQVMAALGDSHGLSLQAHFQPSSATGGDLWGCHEIDQDRIAFYAFDFTGHGLAAALNTFRLHALIHEHRELWAEPSKLLFRLDGTLSRLLPVGQYSTMFYGVLDLRDGLLTWVGGAAPEPLLLRADGSIERLDTRGLPLGLSKYSAPKERPQLTCAMLPGDCLMFHSDGMNEASRPDGELFGDEAVEDLMRTAPRTTEGTRDLEAMMTAFFAQVSAPLDDDLTAVLISRR